jgi:hypothetical protein
MVIWKKMEMVLDLYCYQGKKNGVEKKKKKNIFIINIIKYIFFFSIVVVT